MTKLEINEAQFAKAFKNIAPEYMDDYDDLEDRKSKLCFVWEILEELGCELNIGKAMIAADLDPEMD